jgi:flavodoxin|uniref:Flavodoxin-like domain-containing protein n=1 Tax=candidate division WOR-3 bacterium TaxID=2052148 RepID=A0A7C3UQ88_UNCW3
MRILVVFYSRTGTTKKVGEAIASELKCDWEEVFDTKERKGFFGYLSAGRDAWRERLTILQVIKKDPADYDLIIIGTPVWFFNISTPIRTYIFQYKERFKKIALFVTYRGSGGEGTLTKMADLCGKIPVATLAIREKEVKRGRYLTPVKEFVAKLNE